MFQIDWDIDSHYSLCSIAPIVPSANVLQDWSPLQCSFGPLAFGLEKCNHRLDYLGLSKDTIYDFFNRYATLVFSDESPCYRYISFQSCQSMQTTITEHISRTIEFAYFGWWQLWMDQVPEIYTTIL